MTGAGGQSRAIKALFDALALIALACATPFIVVGAAVLFTLVSIAILALGIAATIWHGAAWVVDSVMGFERP